MTQTKSAVYHVLFQKATLLFCVRLENPNSDESVTLITVMFNEAEDQIKEIHHTSLTSI